LSHRTMGDPRHYLPPAPISVNRLATLPLFKINWQGPRQRLAIMNKKTAIKKVGLLFGVKNVLKIMPLLRWLASGRIIT